VSVRDLTPVEVARGLTEGTMVIVDVREPPEVSLERIAGSQFLPLSAFDQTINLFALAGLSIAIGEMADATIQDVYAALVTDEARNQHIVSDVIHAVEAGRSPLVLTGRTDHISRLEAALVGKIRNVIVLKGGMGRKQRRSVNETLAGIPEGQMPASFAATPSF
jgi:rhodanese-related sulfurtransferase